MCPVTRKEVVTRGRGRNGVSLPSKIKTGIFENGLFPETIQTILQDLDMSHAYLLHGLVGKRI